MLLALFTKRELLVHPTQSPTFPLKAQMLQASFFQVTVLAARAPVLCRNQQKRCECKKPLTSQHMLQDSWT